MSLTLIIPTKTQALLASKARALGVDTSTLASRILEVAATRPSLDDALAEVRANFANSGMSEDQAVDQFEAEKHDLRARRRGKPFEE